MRVVIRNDTPAGGRQGELGCAAESIIKEVKRSGLQTVDGTPESGSLRYEAKAEGLSVEGGKERVQGCREPSPFDGKKCLHATRSRS